ncbi:MAG: hypothetical protein ACUVRJ_08020 [Candidatus Villigracilaceae bacterium]
MTHPDSSASPRPRKPNTPSERMRAILSDARHDGDSPVKPAVRSDPQPAPPSRKKSTPKASTSRPIIRKDKILPAFWTVASIISMTVNIVLFAVIFSLVNNLSSITIEMPSLKNLPGELYRGFEQMDRAHIQAVIPFDAQVPVDFDLEIDAQTEVTLSQDVVVRGAHVTIDTPLININAPANVVLPARTTLPIHLRMTVPVQTLLPTHLEVPVDIDLSQTDLHLPFTGLREAIKPFYCLMEPDAHSMDGLPLCK